VPRYTRTFDILVGAATMGIYRVAPRIGHLERLKRIFGYIKKHPDAAIRFRTRIPDHESYTPPINNNWAQAQYGKGKEELPKDMLTPRGKTMHTTTYADANLMHDLVTGQSMSGVRYPSLCQPDTCKDYIHPLATICQGVGF
jgi:hypothetical protein